MFPLLSPLLQVVAIWKPAVTIYMMIVFWSTVDLTKGLAMQRSLFCSLGRGWNEKAK